MRLLELPADRLQWRPLCGGRSGHYFRRVANSSPARWRCVRCAYVPPVREYRGQLTLFGRNTP